MLATSLLGKNAQEKVGKVDVMYCGDEGIMRGVLHSAISLLKHMKCPLTFHIVTASFASSGQRYRAVTPQSAHMLESALRTYQPGVRVKLYDITEIFTLQPPIANINTRFTPGCMLRLYIDLIDDFPSRVLYLDYDVICRSDPRKLFDEVIGEVRFENIEIAGVPDHYGQWIFAGGPFSRSYVNSGVLIINLKKARETNLFARCRLLCARKRMFMPDQTALNKLAQHKAVLPRCFNEQRHLRDDTVLQHFCTSWRFIPLPHVVSVKPWDKKRMHEVLHLYAYDDLSDECKRWEPMFSLVR